jgi:hypothetical protein
MRMRCPDCHRPVLALFYSVVCESCTSTPRGTFHAAYVVLEEPVTKGCQITYVWRTRHDALRWRTIHGDESQLICCVLSEERFSWRAASGAANGLMVGDRLCEVYPDHRFPPGPWRAFVAPPSVEPRTDRVILPRGNVTAIDGPADELVT